MLSNVFSGAILATLISATICQGQSIAQLGGPSNYPPAGFTGEQFVDARGCVFLRAGYGNAVNWVPRVDRTHKPLCGFPPTFGAAAAAALQADMAPDQAAIIPVAPAPSTGPVPTVFTTAPKVATISPAPVIVNTTTTTYRAPVALVIRPPVVAAPVYRVAPPIVIARNAIPLPPKGYKLAWKDDRLNPQRGLGTVEGQAQQDQIWKHTVPMVLVAVSAPVIQVPRLTTSVSTMSAPIASTRAAYVQIGSFGQPANVTNASARLTALGLPVATAKVTRSGKVIQIVYAGPFASTAAAQSALATVRGAGFGDAILK